VELLESQYPPQMIPLLAVLLAAVFIAQRITQRERRLITGSALLLAGIFFLTKPAAPLAITLVALLVWGWGLIMFVREALQWQRANASPAGPLAILFLLPPAVFGAILLVGVVVSFLVAPARLVARIVGG
jgi:uncharacterized paraquat-inducible protein A